MADSAEQGGGRWRLFAGLVLLAAIMALSLTVWFITRDDGGALTAENAAVPIVRAPEGPDRVKPKDPGGEQVPDQDKQVYETFKPAKDREQPTVERLLPRAEQPLPEPEPKPQAQPKPQPEPRPVQQAAPAPQPAPNPQPQPAGGVWRVQLAALRDEAAAARTWQKISGQQKALLGSLTPTFSRVETETKGTFYRLRVGQFTTRAEAEALCQRLKKAGQDCLVAKG